MAASFVTCASAERRFAQRAGEAALNICDRAPRELHRSKRDASPVCLADLAIQATVQHMLYNTFPNDTLLAEEQLPDLRILQPLLDFTPLRRYPRTGGRQWVLDPIDGTAGFLKDAAYASGLCLPGVVASLALPQERLILLADAGLEEVARDREGRTEAACTGWLLSAGEGRVPAWGPPRTLCCGSLVKYAAVARAHAFAFVQILRGAEKAWDHAAGLAVVAAAGGCVSDERGGEVALQASGLRVAGGAIVATAPGTNHVAACADVRQALHARDLS